MIDVFSALLGAAVPAEANALRKLEDAAVISVLPAASITNARPSARLMMMNGWGFKCCEVWEAGRVRQRNGRVRKWTGDEFDV